MLNELFVIIFNDPIDGRSRVKIRAQLIGGREFVHLFDLPFELRLLPQHYARLDEWITAASNQLIQKGLLDSNANLHERLQRVGAALFDALFPKGSEGRGFYHAQADRVERSKNPLRIRLEVEQALNGIPWNILWDTTYRRWLAQDRSRTLIQTPHGSMSAKLRMSRRREHLHVVLVTASAAHPSSPEADQRYTEQLQGCLAALHHKHSIDLEVLKGHNTYGQLDYRLRQNKPLHILDIFAHGKLDGGEHILCLTDQAGDIVRLPSTWLTDALRQRQKNLPQHHLFLTLLNNCDSAHGIPQSLLTNLTATLVAGGAQAALGMQSLVWVDVIHKLMPLLYEAMLSGQTVDQALNSARRTLYNDRYSEIDWAVPVLYVGPNVQNLCLPKSPKSQAQPTSAAQVTSPIQIIRGESLAVPIQISREEFLAAHALREGTGRSQLFAKRSEDFQEELDAIFVEGPLKMLANHDPNTLLPITPALGPSKLGAHQSLFLIAPPGHGKSGYRLSIERRIKTTDLVVSVDFGISLEEANAMTRDGCLALIKRKIAKALHQNLSPEKETELQRLLEKEVGATPLPFGEWIERLVELVRSSGVQQIHFIFDGLDNLGRNFTKVTEFLAHLIGRPTILRRPGIAFKFFLPDDAANTMQNFIIAQLGSQRADFPIYRLVDWNESQLLKFVNQRLNHFTIRTDDPLRPPVRLQDLFDVKVAPTIEDRLCSAAQGSPRRLIELLECMVDQHCATCHYSSDHIPQAAINDCLRLYV